MAQDVEELAVRNGAGPVVRDAKESALQEGRGAAVRGVRGLAARNGGAPAVRDARGSAVHDGRAAGAAALAVVAVVALALNLRPALAGFSPLAGEAGAELGLGAGALSLVTTLPLLCFGVFALLAPALGRRFGTERTLAASMLLLAAGILLRGAAGTVALICGTVLVGVAIAIGNVLLPGMVKRRFSGRTGVMTGVYAAAIGGGAMFAAALAKPLDGLTHGWRTSLAVWALPALAAAVPLALLGRSATGSGVTSGAPADGSTADRGGAIGWRTAGTLAAYFGLQSIVFYVVLAWLPRVLTEAGTAPAEAGLPLSLVQLVGLPVGLAVPVLARTSRSQAWYAVACGAASALGFTGLLVAPGAAPYAWAFLLGLGIAAFPLALAMVTARAGGPAQADRLSSVVQSCGYLMSAAGPLAAGLLRDVTGTWTASLAVMVVVAALMALLGWLAARL
ncbi:MFS transporter [Streptosporangium carneum]|uniref:MFS transporter n=1 Tax=Streptosporangium carneum TaxID=47481 RepID=UPI0022F2E642|nr:MFS transporter [Streptosporangium carneum]